jgi:hypothetical protein
MGREFEKSLADILRKIPGESLKISGMSLESVALALTGMIDGFWIQYLIAPNRLNPIDAIRPVWLICRVSSPVSGKREKQRGNSPFHFDRSLAKVIKRIERNLSRMKV